MHVNQERNLVMPAEEEIDTVERSSIKKLKDFQTPRKHPLSQPVLFFVFFKCSRIVAKLKLANSHAHAHRADIYLKGNFF